MIKAQDVAKLRAETGVGIMDAKKALESSNGDFDKAIEILKSNFASKAVKKSDRETTEGVIGSYIHNGKKGIMVSLSCETDFVARNQDFKDLANNIALQVASLGIDNISINEILESSYIKDPSITIEELIKSKIVTIGENIKIKGIVTISL